MIALKPNRWLKNDDTHLGEKIVKQKTFFSVKKSWRLFLADMNIPSSHVLKLAGLPEDLFCRNDLQLETDEFFRFWRALEHLIGEQHLLIELVSRLNSDSFDPAVFAFLCSPSLNVALDRLALYEELISPVCLGVTAEPLDTAVTLQFVTGIDDAPVSFSLFKLLYIKRFAEIAIRQEIIPISISLNQPFPYLKSYSEHFGINIVIGECNQIVFSASDARKPFLTEDSKMWDFFSSSYNIRKSSLSPNASTEKRLSNVLVEMLPSGEHSITEASKRLAMSVRSLQRKLKQEQLSFKAILNSIRWELANRYLLEPEVSTAEVAYLLAYNDPSSFQKAYKNWSGITPSQYRLNHCRHKDKG